MSKMSSKDKEKTLHDRLKQFFRLNKGGSGKRHHTFCRLFIYAFQSHIFFFLQVISKAGKIFL